MRTSFGPGTVVVDDFDPSILYTCGGGQAWWLGGAAGLEYNTTAHGASSTVCTFSYTFSGTYVAVYGTIPGYFDTIPGAGATSQYFLDNLTVPYDTFTAQPTVNTTYQQLFFSSGILSQGTHSLTVTLAEDTVVDDSPGYWVDLLVIIPDSNVTSDSGGITRSSLPPSTSTSTSTSTIPDVTTTVTLTQGPRGRSSVPTGAIVGAILGGVIIFIGLIWLVFLLRRQCHRKVPNSIEQGPQQQTSQSPPRINSTTITPFILTSHQHSPSQTSLSTPIFSSRYSSNSVGQVKTPIQTTGTRLPGLGGVSEVQISEMPPPYLNGESL